jgi:hypothetical protein
MNTFSNTKPEGTNLLPALCPMDGAICDRTCGFTTHGIHTRAIPVPHEHLMIQCQYCKKFLAKCKCIGENPFTMQDRVCEDCEKYQEGLKVESELKPLENK